MTTKNILTLIIVTFILANCSNSHTKYEKENDNIGLVPEPDRPDRLLGEAVKKIKKINCDFSDPDTSLCGITLRNSLSADKVIGTDNNTDEREQYHFYSILDNETLTLTQHPGDRKNQISVFNISYSDKAYHSYKQLNLAAFKTEKGIKLGLTKEEVIEKLGTCYAVVDSTKDCSEIYYRIERSKDTKTKLLETNNLPIYYAIYTFYKNKLRYYEFGFEYP